MEFCGILYLNHEIFNLYNGWNATLMNAVGVKDQFPSTGGIPNTSCTLLHVKGMLGPPSNWSL